VSSTLGAKSTLKDRKYKTKSEIKRLREALSDVEDKLRHAGGDSGWASE
jgi:hypothetical protein